MGGYIMVEQIQLVDREVVDRDWYLLALSLSFIGFAAACVVAWFHGEKGRQEFGKLELVLLGFLGVVAVAVSAIILT